MASDDVAAIFFKGRELGLTEASTHTATRPPVPWNFSAADLLWPCPPCPAVLASSGAASRMTSMRGEHFRSPCRDAQVRRWASWQPTALTMMAW